MTPSDDKEKRGHSRVDFTTRIRVVMNAKGKTARFEASSKDLSLKGVFVNSDDTFEEGTPCEIDIFLTGSTEKIVLNIQGTVVRTEERGMAVSFDTMDVDSYAHLRNIIAYNMDDD